MGSERQRWLIPVVKGRGRACAPFLGRSDVLTRKELGYGRENL